MLTNIQQAFLRTTALAHTTTESASLVHNQRPRAKYMDNDTTAPHISELHLVDIGEYGCDVEVEDGGQDRI